MEFLCKLNNYRYYLLWVANAPLPDYYALALGERRALAIGEGRVGERGECMAPMGGGLRPIFGVVVGR